MKLALIGFAATLVFATVPTAAAVPSTDVVSKMFTWWDAAFKQQDGFTDTAFRQFFTEDATLTLEGKTVIHGISEWVDHFRKIQASGREVEIVVPFKDVFASGDRIFTYHVIRSRGGGATTCALAAGDALLRNGKIASITLVRANLDAQSVKNEHDCWTN